MPSVALPSSTVAEAEAVIRRRLQVPFSLKTRLEELGGATAVQLMLDLEERFHVLIEVDEVLPHGTVGSLVTLAVMRAPHPLRADPCNLIDLAAARAARARRTQHDFGAPEPPRHEPPLYGAAVPDNPPDFPPDFLDESRASEKLLKAALLCVLVGAAAAIVFFAFAPYLA